MPRVVASPSWRASVRPFFPATVFTSADVERARVIFDDKTNLIIARPAKHSLDENKYVPLFDRLARLVRFRTDKAKFGDGESDDFDSDLFRSWRLEKDGRTVERLLVASLIASDVVTKRGNWFGTEASKASPCSCGLAPSVVSSH